MELMARQIVQLLEKGTLTNPVVAKLAADSGGASAAATTAKGKGVSASERGSAGKNEPQTRIVDAADHGYNASLTTALKDSRMRNSLDEPKSYQAIMVSSTFTDLKDHRQQVIRAIEALGYRANVMEHDGARADADVIESSLQFVRDSAAYVGVISH